ncbi:hypothetical protein C8Q80DRAFT_1124994 [Daedaleopsis nitida]|nr:hypothetical protein C8Q80DRAFT_1124994 [Daedaleopsis nitida]
MSQNKPAGIFSAIPGHLMESTPRRGRGRRNLRKRKLAPPSPLGQANISNSSPAPPQTPSLEKRPNSLKGITSSERDPPPHLPGTTTGERAAAAETVAVMRNDMRVLEEVQTSLEAGMDEVHASVAASEERLSGLMEELLVGQQQMMDTTCC